MHYGIETVKGARFREVTLPDESRYGLLGKGAVLMLTAYPNRTSPVLRGAWISGAPARLAAAGAAGRRAGPHRQQARRAAANAARAPRAAPRESDLLLVPRRHGSARLRARELQRRRPVPHAWIPDTRTPIDASGTLPDGTAVTSAGDLRRALAAHPEQVRAGADREPVDVRAGPDARTIATCRRCARSCARAAKDDYRFESIVLGIVSSDAFRKREADGGMRQASLAVSPLQ